MQNSHSMTCIFYLGTRYENSTQAIKTVVKHSLARSSITVLGLQREQAERPAKQVGKVVQQDEPVSEDGHWDGLEMIKLHRNFFWQHAHQLASERGPADSVC